MIIVENYIGTNFPYHGIPCIDQVIVTLHQHDVRWGWKLNKVPTPTQLKDPLFHAVEDNGRWYILKGFAQ